jgi:site-specific DNA recombinase
MRAVLYCRVSTVEQTQNLSLSTQEKACRAYAEREGYEVGDVFVDRGESAKTVDRPEFRRLLAHCRQHAGRIQAVIVYGLSRFSRNSTDHHAIAALLRGHGIALRSVTEPIDDSPAGRFMEGICAAMAQFDNDLKSDRTKVGMRAALERGRWVWQAPLGYRNGARGAGEPSLVPTEHADVIRDTFADVADGHRTLSEAFAHLQAVGVRGRRSPLALQTFHRLLRNPVYCGRVYSPGFAVDRAGDWVPLVDEATWRRVQLRLEPAEPEPVRQADRADFPLRRFAHCGTCGNPLTGGWSAGRSAKYAYYHCRRRCVTATVRELEAAFLVYLDSLRPDPDFLRLLQRDVLATWRDEVDRAAGERGKLEAQATRLRSQLRRLDEAFLYDQSIDQATYSTRRDEARHQLAATEVELSAAVIETIDAEGVLAQAHYAMEHAGALWRSAQNARQRVKLQWALLPDGVVWTGSAVLNRGTSFCFYEIGGVSGPENQGASPMPAMLNRLTAWASAWRGYLDAA